MGKKDELSWLEVLVAMGVVVVAVCAVLSPTPSSITMPRHFLELTVILFGLSVLVFVISGAVHDWWKKRHKR